MAGDGRTAGVRSQRSRMVRVAILQVLLVISWRSSVSQAAGWRCSSSRSRPQGISIAPGRVWPR
eukprot:5157405-Prorocentrum_lima.AAC.1